MIKLAEPWRKEGQVGFRVIGLERKGGLSHWVHIRTDVSSVHELKIVIESNLNHYSKVRVFPNVFVGDSYHYSLPNIEISKKSWTVLKD